MPHSGVNLIDPHKIFEKISLSAGMRVADLGCGRTGHFVFPAAKLVGDTGIVYAVDIMKDILENIKSRAKTEGFGNVRAVWSDIEKPGAIPIPAKSLDVCFFINVMFQLKEREAAIEEAARLLKSGGFLVVVDWRKKLGPLGPELGQTTSPEKIIESAERYGVRIIERCEAGDYHYCLILKKGGETGN